MRTLRVPDGGRQPDAVIDGEGTIHMIYVVGEPRNGDLMYVRRPSGAGTWSDPLRVNSEPETVTGIGPIDGGQLALGRDNRLHVAWFQISPIEFFYTRTNANDSGFEPQFGVAAGSGVAAGPAIAADRAGGQFPRLNQLVGERSRPQVSGPRASTSEQRKNGRGGI